MKNNKIIRVLIKHNPKSNIAAEYLNGEESRIGKYIRANLEHLYKFR